MLAGAGSLGTVVVVSSGGAVVVVVSSGGAVVVVVSSGGAVVVVVSSGGAVVVVVSGGAVVVVVSGGAVVVVVSSATAAPTGMAISATDSMHATAARMSTARARSRLHGFATSRPRLLNLLYLARPMARFTPPRGSAQSIENGRVVSARAPFRGNCPLDAAPRRGPKLSHSGLSPAVTTVGHWSGHGAG